MKHLLCFLLVASSVLTAKGLNVEISAPSAILINAQTGEILFEKEAHKRCYPASITKVATALYILEKKGHALDEEALATHDCIATVPTSAKRAANSPHPPYRLEVGGSHIALRLGEVLSLKTLLYGLMLSSGNDAANVLAQHISGDIAKFMDALNTFLKEKGVKESCFLNPHGLHHPDHYTTAYDMSLIAKEALKHPFFREVVKTVQYPRPQTGGQPQTYFVQSNKLMRRGAYFYPKATGIKTGHTGPAGYTLVASAEHKGRQLIAVILGCSDAEQRYKEVVKLFEAAFAEQPVLRTLFSAAYDHFHKSLKGAKTELSAGLTKDVEMAFYPSEEPTLQAHIHWDPVRLPVAEGQKVGTLQLKTALGEVVKEEPLYALKAVRRTAFKAFIDLCVDYRKVLILSFLGLNIGVMLVYLFKKAHKVH